VLRPPHARPHRVRRGAFRSAVRAGAGTTTAASTRTVIKPSKIESPAPVAGTSRRRADDIRNGRCLRSYGAAVRGIRLKQAALPFRRCRAMVSPGGRPGSCARSDAGANADSRLGRSADGNGLRSTGKQEAPLSGPPAVPNRTRHRGNSRQSRSRPRRRGSGRRPGDDLPQNAG
jgi:hypothetical protein